MTKSEKVKFLTSIENDCGFISFGATEQSKESFIDTCLEHICTITDVLVDNIRPKIYTVLDENKSGESL